MTKERVYLFDTTLRDGAQTQGVDFSVEDKRTIALALDSLGFDYVEGGWPGANPTDTNFFADPPPLTRARFTAFGMTKRAGRSAANDPGVAALLDAACDTICFVAQSWDAYPAARDVVVPVAAGNHASWRALERVGFVRIAEGPLEPDNPIDPPDHVVYRLARPAA